jgi:hypothetical protein
MYYLRWRRAPGSTGDGVLSLDEPSARTSQAATVNAATT